MVDTQAFMRWSRANSITDAGLDIVLQQGDAAPALLHPAHSHLAVGDESICNSLRHLQPCLIDSKKVGFLDLPGELRWYIYELYCSSITKSTAESSPSGQKQRDEHNQDILKPQLLCHQLRDEYLDAWAGVAIIELPSQTTEWLPTGNVFTHRLDPSGQIQHLYTMIRDWLAKVPSNIRHRLRHLRVTYYRALSGYRQDRAATMQFLWEEALHKLMERLDDVHVHISVEVHVLIPRSQ